MSITDYPSIWASPNRPRAGSASSAMTLSVPECAELNRAKMASKRKMSLGSAPLLNGNGLLQRSPPPRRTSIAVCTLAVTGRSTAKRRQAAAANSHLILCMSTGRVRCAATTVVGNQLRVTDAFSESIRTLASTARRNSSPLSRKSTKKLKKSRLISKNGMCNVYNKNVPQRDRQYLRDIFTTLIDVKWRYMLSIFGIVFALSWSTFATAYYTIAVVHGDLFSDGAIEHVNHTHCVVNLDSFYSSFLFAVETHHTIGYGHRYITTECPLAGLTVCLQAVTGLLIQSFMVGLVFAKLARAKKRAETIIFSEKAVICLRDGMLCLLCRIGDMRNTHLVEAHVRLQFISERETLEGEVEPLHQHEMKVGTGCVDDDRLFLIWPVTIVHVIDEHSPLFEYTANTLVSGQFEIVVILEGIVESTGMTVQAKTSYLPCEINWGQRFRKLVTYQRGFSNYVVDYDVFNATYTVKTPTWSAKEHYSKNNDPKEFYCVTDTNEIKVEDNRSWESSPIPSPSPFSNPSSPLPLAHPYPKASAKSMEETALLCPPTIVVQCPSTCNSPSHPNRRGFNHYERSASSGEPSTRPSTALSDLIEESSEHESPTRYESKAIHHLSF